MSTFEDSRYRWRETYFVLFHSSDRPMLKTVEEAISTLCERYELKNLRADDEGRFDSLSLISPDDCAAMDICYTEGPDVLEQGAELAEQIEPGELAAARQIRQCDARFDVLHFEETPEIPDDDDEVDDILDPSALLLVLGTLGELTGGLAVDPQSGTLLCDED